MDDLFDVADDGRIVLRLHVQPGAGRSAAVGRHGDALKVRVAAPPERGRANEACVALVADLLGVKPAAVEVVSGEASRAKRLAVAGVEVDDVRRTLDAATAARPDGTRPDADRDGRRR